LLVSDVITPQMFGPELVKRIAAIRPQSRVVLMSAHIEWVRLL